MTEIATVDWFGGGGHLFSLKTLLYWKFKTSPDNFVHQGNILYKLDLNVPILIK